MTAPVLSPAEALEHPQIADRIVRRPEDAPPRVGLPACGSGVPEPDDESLPRQGEDTAAVLRELGYEKATIDRLAAAGAIEVG